MIIDRHDLGTALNYEIITKDSYKLRRYIDTDDITHPDIATVIDVGANYGFFAVYARCLFPHARVVCFEPNPTTFAGLVKNVDCLDVETHMYGLGDGDPILLENRPFSNDSGSKVARKLRDEENIGTKTAYLSELLKIAKVDLTKPYIIKVDCEGGEQYIFGKDDEILGNSEQWMMEMHFCKTRWPNTPTKQQYADWCEKQKVDFPNRSYEGRWTKRMSTVVSTKS